MNTQTGEENGIHRDRGGGMNTQTGEERKQVHRGTEEAEMWPSDLL